MFFFWKKFWELEIVCFYFYKLFDFNWFLAVLGGFLFVIAGHKKWVQIVFLFFLNFFKFERLKNCIKNWHLIQWVLLVWSLNEQWKIIFQSSPKKIVYCRHYSMQNVKVIFARVAIQWLSKRKNFFISLFLKRRWSFYG